MDNLKIRHIKMREFRTIEVLDLRLYGTDGWFAKQLIQYGEKHASRFCKVIQTPDRLWGYFFYTMYPKTVWLGRHGFQPDLGLAPHRAMLEHLLGFLGTRPWRRQSLIVPVPERHLSLQLLLKEMDFRCFRMATRPQSRDEVWLFRREAVESPVSPITTHEVRVC